MVVSLAEDIADERFYDFFQVLVDLNPPGRGVNTDFAQHFDGVAFDCIRIDGAG